MKFFTSTLLFTICAITVQAQGLNEKDWEFAHKIKQEAVTNSRIEDMVYRLVDRSGSRLAGSDGMELGMTIAKGFLTEFGVENARSEFAAELPMGGWDNVKSYVAMRLPYHVSIFAAPVVWTGSTKGAINGDVLLIDAKSIEDMKKYKGKLKDRIVLMPNRARYDMSFSPLATRQTDVSLRAIESYPIVETAPRTPSSSSYYDISASEYNKILAFVRGESAAMIINESGDFNNPAIAFNKEHKKGAEPSPCEINITLEIHGLMERLIKNGEKVTIEAEVTNKFHADRNIHNLMGEIKGIDPLLSQQIVMVGAHLDCYSIGGGAGDNSVGVIAMSEAMRILKAIGYTPKRTVRIVLWGGEEVGIFGSKGYVHQNVKDANSGKLLGEHEKISVYFNSDYGPGKFRGIYTQDNIRVYPIFTQWKEPFEHLGFTTVSNRGVGSTDHIPFDVAGIPAFQFIQDNLEWGRGSHRSTDYADRLIISDIQHNAIIAAWFIYKACEMDGMMPRK